VNRNLRLIVPEDLFEIGSIADGRLSPDGRYAAYTLRRTDKTTDVDRIRVMLFDTVTDDVKQVSPENYNCSSLAWSANGECLFYTSSRENGSQIYSVDIATLSEHLLTDVKGRNHWRCCHFSGRELSCICFSQRFTAHRHNKAIPVDPGNFPG
jgi:sugar lactone lactonase YvrE